ncbi:hypothetical protein VSR01_27335 [Actinacidiphila sp. DG2A-62]|nr:hypothetical protein [Actinacidiphila sp. DG2A-62]MEC3997021.1 hypothetical protein [Actinacidiphila sp. DG2A-62]
MTLRFIGTTSEHGNCPTLYEVVETGEILVQGERERRTPSISLNSGT